MTDQKTILLAEDQVNINRLIAAKLNREGFRVIQAYDGEEAIRLLLNQEVDLTLLNLMMPQLDGGQVLRRVRSAGKTIPVIIFSVKNRESDLQYCLQLGADDYLVKPFELDDLFRRVKKLIGER